MVKNKLPTIKVAAIMAMDLEKIQNLKSNLNILFEDGVIEENCSYKNVILFRYLFDFARNLPKIPITSKMYIRNHLVGGYFNASTYTKMYSVFYKDFVEQVVKPTNRVELIEEMTKGMYESVNKVTRDFSKLLGDYVIGIEITDILDVQFRKTLLDSIVDVVKDPKQDKIEKSYKALEKVVKEELDDDSIIRLIYLSEMVNKNQINQLFGSRGFLTEINSRIFKLPMTNSFTLGCKNIYEMAIESRAGAKALYLSSKAIQDSEYMARELQLATMYVEKIEFTDCGSTDYVDFYVEPRQVDETGKEIYKGDLRNLIGKRFFNPETGKEEIITKDHTWLEGKTIKLRSAFNCKLRDKKKICAACIGELAYSIFRHQNIGHLNTVNVTRPISQSIISTKHLTKSASSQAIVLDDLASKFFMVKDKDKLYFYSKYFGRKTKKLKLIIPQEQAFGLKDVVNVGDVLKINLNKVSRVRAITIAEEAPNNTDYYPIEIKTGNRYGFFTNYFWNYVIKNGYEVDDMDNYVIDLEHWDYKKPILQYEKVEFDFAALSKDFKKLFKSIKYLKTKDGVKRSEYEPNVLVQRLFKLVNKKLDINIALLEVIVYAFTAQDLTNDNYDLGRNAVHKDLIRPQPAIDYRSLGSAYNWNKLHTKVFDPIMYKEYDKPDHPLDVLLKPNEVLKYVGEV